MNTHNEILNDNELQILQLAANGQRTKEMSSEMQLSPETVETYRKNLVRKTGYSTLTQVVATAIREKWIE